MPNISGYKICILTAPRLLIGNSNNVRGGLKNNGPQVRKGEIDASLGILGQAEFAFNEEQHSEKEDLFTRIDILEGVLFQAEGKG